MDRTIAAEIAALAAVMVLWLAILRDAWRAWQPARLLLLGRYAEALVAAKKLELSWMRLFASVRLSARYAIGCALHLQGELEESIKALAPLHKEKLAGNLQYAVCSIEAASLVLLDRDHQRAMDLLEEARLVHRPPEDLLLAAHAKHGLGDTDGAEKLFLAAGKTRSSAGLRLGSVLLVEDQKQQEAIFHTLRGVYLVKVGKESTAQRDFEIAAKSPITNVYVERARAMLQAKGTKPSDDPRSSLAPQTVAKESSEESSSDSLEDN
jgi:hypothetical protein